MKRLRQAMILLFVAWSSAALAETGDTGDTGESGETGDSAVDTGELQEAYSLSERTGEEGGCGFGSKAALFAPGLLIGLALARRRGADPR